MRLKKSIKIGIFATLAVFLFMVGGIGVYTHSIMKKIDRKEISQKPEELGIDTQIFESMKNTHEVNNSEENASPIEEKLKDITNIALLGIDSENGEAGRADTIMIFTLDEFRKKIKLTSIMRDSYVNIDGHGMDKINHSYAFGGAQLAIKTINQNFKLNIKDYALVNFSTLPKIVDALGGVQVAIKDYEISLMQYEGIKTPGNYTLSGSQALAYSRIRYVGNGDYERTERQRTILNAIFNTVINSDKTRLPFLAEKLLSMIESSLSNMQIVSLGYKSFDMNMKNLELQRFPLDGYSEGKMINNIWYLTFDLNIASEQVFNYIFEDKNPGN